MRVEEGDMKSTHWGSHGGSHGGTRAQAQLSAAEQAASLDPPMKPHGNIISGPFRARLVSLAIAWLGFGVIAAFVSVGLMRTTRR
jgi:hypothetical protein